MRQITESEKARVAWKKQQITARVRVLLEEYDKEQRSFYWGRIDAVIFTRREMNRIRRSQYL